MISVVTPWRTLLSALGLIGSVKSEWVLMSMKPGATARPWRRWSCSPARRVRRDRGDAAVARWRDRPARRASRCRRTAVPPRIRMSCTEQFLFGATGFGSHHDAPRRIGLEAAIEHGPGSISVDMESPTEGIVALGVRASLLCSRCFGVRIGRSCWQPDGCLGGGALQLDRCIRPGDWRSPASPRRRCSPMGSGRPAGQLPIVSHCQRHQKGMSKCVTRRIL